MIAQLAQDTLARLDGLPGMESASVANFSPMGRDVGRRFQTEGSTEPGPRTLINSVGPRYFETIGIALIRGREFSQDDRVGSPAVAIVNETFAKRYFGSGDAIGKRVRFAAEPYVEIVGMVRDSNYSFFGETAKPALYFAHAQSPGGLTIHMRFKGPPEPHIAAVRRTIADFDPTLAVTVETIRQATSFEFVLRDSFTRLLTMVGWQALFLAMVGVYGLISYNVASRTAEIGIRVALGAGPRRIVWTMLGDGLKLVAIGAMIGLVVSSLATPYLAPFLAGLSPYDPLTFASVLLAFMVIGLVSGYIPARRATRVDPIIALRQQ